MTLTEFRNGYWYAVDLKAFAKQLNIPQFSQLRKDQLEVAIEHFLKTGRIKKGRATASQSSPGQKRRSKKFDQKDSDTRLTMRTKVVNYTNNPETKNWIVTQAHKLDKSFKERSGARYRLNRWREEQLAKGKSLTYGDLVHEYVKLNRPETLYKKIATTRYLNFLSDFAKNEKGATKKTALAAWQELKEMNIPKTYTAWKKVRKQMK